MFLSGMAEEKFVGENINTDNVNIQRAGLIIFSFL